MANPRRFDFDLVGVGALNVDHVHTVSRVTLDGLERVLASLADAGGCAANATYALARLGLRSGFLGAVGDDEGAQVVLASFRSAGVDTTGIVREVDTRTGRVIILSDDEGRRAMYMEPGANHRYAAHHLPPRYLSGLPLLLVSSFNGELAPEVQKALLGALPSEAKVALILDGLFARRGMEAMRPLLSRCDLLFGNRAEIEDATAGEGPPRLLAEGCRTVVVTLGAGEEDAACRIYSAQEEWAVPAERTFGGPIADATGAGDAFAAGYLWGMLADWPPPRCGSLGHTLAGFVLGAPGCRAGVPGQEELLERHRRFFAG